MIDLQHKWNTNIKPLVIGFLLSLFLIGLAYFISTYHIQKGLTLILSVMGLAILQGLCQLIFFFHIGVESSPKWGLISLVLTSVILIIIVGGSLWVMYDLDYMMMPNMTM